MRWKDFLYFKRNSKFGVILLLILILLTLILNAFLSYRQSSDIILIQNDSLVRDFDEFRRTLTVREPNISNKKPDAGADFSTHSSRRTGFSQETTSPETIIKGAENGDTTTEETSINKYATQIKSEGETDSRNNFGYLDRNLERSSSRTSKPFTEKLSVGETISMNRADTTEWKKIPGIGSAYASRIVKYRDLLGGFVHVEQLLEVYGIDHDLFARIAPYIETDGDFKKVQINRLEFNDLLRHPYLNYKQVQAIMSVRRRKGDITSIRELSMLKEFTTDEILRLEPYLGF